MKIQNKYVKIQIRMQMLIMYTDTITGTNTGPWRPDVQDMRRSFKKRSPAPEISR